MATTKNKIPPHADRPNERNSPDRINLINEIFPLLNFIPDTKR